MGGLPTPDVLDRQPDWAWYLAWPELVISENPNGIGDTTGDPRVLGLSRLTERARTA